MRATHHRVAPIASSDGRVRVGSVVEPHPKARSIIILLAASLVLTESGYGIAMPVFAKRLAELGPGWRRSAI